MNKLYSGLLLVSLIICISNISYAENGCDLILKDWSWTIDNSYAKVNGRIQNSTGRRLENVSVHVEYYTKDNHFITHDKSIIEFHVLLPNQTSPFDILTRMNPAMETAKIYFTDFWARKKYRTCKGKPEPTNYKPTVEHNDKLERIQKDLKQLGFYNGKVDGLFGPKTKKSIIDFKKAYNNIPEFEKINVSSILDYEFDRCLKNYKSWISNKDNKK